MRTIISAIAVFISLTASAQNTTTENIIEGSKALVELVRVLKTPVYSNYQPEVAIKPDSCQLKNLSDLCFKNSTDKSVYVSLFKRTGNLYEPNVLTIKILPKTQEYWYELKCGIYKFKIDVDAADGKRMLYREAELKLVACENLIKEIK